MGGVLRGVVLSMLLSGFQVKAQTTASATVSHHDLPVKADEIHWSKLVWYSATIGGKKVAHAAPFIEIHVDGMAQPALMELDTGTDISSLYGKTLTRVIPSIQSKKLAVVSGTMAGCPFANEKFEVLADQGDTSTADGRVYLGTVGLGFFRDRILFMDLVSNEVAILPKGVELPASLVSRAQSVPAGVRGGKLYVTLKANGALEQDMFFDTGSSSSTLVTAPATWKRLTGRQPGDPRNSRWVSSNWGKDSVMIGSPASGNVCVGSACVSRPTIKFESTGLENFDFAKYPVKTDRYFGVMLFDGRFTVVIDRAHGRFELVRGSMAHQSWGKQ